MFAIGLVPRQSGLSVAVVLRPLGLWTHAVAAPRRSSPPSDTLPEPEAVCFALLAAVPSERKFAVWAESTCMDRAVTLAAILEAGPGFAPARPLRRLDALW